MANVLTDLAQQIADDAANCLAALGITATAAEVNLTDGLLATTAEINAVADVSTRIVASDAALTVTAALHAGKTVLMGGTGSSFTKTLPAAAGTGNIYRFVVGTVNTSNHVINAATNSGAFYGLITQVDKDSTAATGYHAAGGSSADVITLNGTTTGGLVGDWIEVQDIATNTWAVRGMCGVPAGSNIATPFS
jgi:hypothetical protein